MTEIPPHWSDENPGSYAQRLLGLWATNDAEAQAAWATMMTWEVRREDADVADDCLRALAIVRGDAPLS